MIGLHPWWCIFSEVWIIGRVRIREHFNKENGAVEVKTST